MPRKILYRRQLLRAIEAFLEGTPSSSVRAHRIIQHCSAAIYAEAKEYTLDQVIWNALIRALTDSVFYENEEYLREIRESLLGRSPQNIERAGFREDFRSRFTADEAEWYAELGNMVRFIQTVPFTKIHEATFSIWQQKAIWTTVWKTLPEAVQAEEIETEYRRRKTIIETIAARSPSPESMGDETIYHIVLREVTNLLRGISVGRAAVYCGYPILDAPYTGYGNGIDVAPGIHLYALDMSESLKWASSVLRALAGEGGFFLSWTLRKAPTFDADVVLLSLH